ncbi:MAG: glycosyltransferase [Bacteroidales bacterium]
MNNICFFNATTFWGGGEKLHLEYAIGFKEKGYHISIITKRNSPLLVKSLENEITVFTVTIRNLSFLNPLKYIRIIRFLRHAEIDTIIFSTSQDLKIGSIASKMAGVERIVYLRGLAVPIKNSLLNRLILKRMVTHIIANSKETRKKIIENFNDKLLNKKIKVIYHGLNFKEYDNAPVIKSYRLPGDNFIIGNLGRIVKQKGQQYLIDLATIIKERKIAAKIIIGGDGPLKDEITKLRKKHHVEDIVQLVGFVHDVKGFMSSLDIFVLTSLWEGFGYVIAEALYFEKPVIAFDVSSNPELIEDGKSGFLVEPGNINAVADKIAFLIKNKASLKKMGREGKKFVTENLTFQKSLSEIVDFLKKQESLV